MNALKQMLALAERPTAVVLKGRNTGAIPTIGEIADRGNQLMENMFGIEESAKVATHQFLMNLYPRLSLEPLKWHGENGFPRLVIFSLDSPEYKLRYEEVQGGTSVNDWYYYFSCAEPKNLPKEIAVCYKILAHYYEGHPAWKSETDSRKLFNMIRRIIGDSIPKRSGSGNTKVCDITYRFSGFIPVPVKQRIVEAMKVFPKDMIFIIAEPGPIVSIEAIPTQVDPLVVGWNEETKSLHLIADFNTTGVEEAMIFEPPDKKD